MSESVKALFRRGKALAMLKDYDEAIPIFERVIALGQTTSDVKRELASAQKKLALAKKAESRFISGSLSLVVFVIRAGKRRRAVR